MDDNEKIPPDDPGINGPDDNEKNGSGDHPSTPEQRRQEAVRRLKEGVRTYEAVEGPGQPCNAPTRLPAAEIEGWQIEQVLREVKGELVNAAIKLGISRHTLWR